MLQKAVVVIVAVFLCAAVTAQERVFPEGASAFGLSPHWQRGQECPMDQKIDLIFAIKQQNLDLLDKIFWEVSDPDSPEYGKFLTAEQLGKLIRPKDESIDTILKWLHQQGVSAKSYRFTPHKEFLKVFVDVAKASELLGGIKFHYFSPAVKTASTSRLRLARSLDAYSLPAEVAAHVDFVGGVARLPKIKTMKVTPLSNQYSAVTPSVIKQAFNITAVGSSSKNLQSVNQFLGQFFSPADLTSFQQQFNVPVQSVSKVYGPNVPSNPGVEAALDIEYIMGVANNIPTWFISTGGEHEGQEPFLEWIVNMTSLGNAAPYVFSVSYGDVESSITMSYATRVSTEFQKIGITGRSVIYASGDDGAGCSSSCNSFEPNWPASSPFVTAVGGTVLGSISPLSIQSDAISSGGFSNYFRRPSYQANAVNRYLSQSGLPQPSFYNVQGRAIPDVSSFSENVVIVYQGGQFGVGGTSCAAPVFSAIIALINDERLQNGKSTLGFLNPILYSKVTQFPSMFLDITTGPTNADGCCPGFPPTVGWDAVTGLGVPNYPGMRAALA